VNENVHDMEATLVGIVRCDGCGAEWYDMDAATDQDGRSDIGCPNRCGRLTTAVYWPDANAPLGWSRD
jgi:hypothetical protein